MIVTWLIALLLGCVFAAVVNLANHFFPDETADRTVLEVVAGVSLTLGLGWGAESAGIGPSASWPWIFALFVATGLPMGMGCMIRHGIVAYQQRQRDRELELEDAHGRTLG